MKPKSVPANKNARNAESKYHSVQNKRDSPWRLSGREADRWEKRYIRGHGEYRFNRIESKGE